MRKLFKKTTLYVVRCDTNEKLQDLGWEITTDLMTGLANLVKE